MAINLATTYPGRTEAANAAYPQGSFKNRTAPGSLDGTYLEKQWANDIQGFLQALMANSGIVPNDTVDTAVASQYYDAMVSIMGGGALLWNVSTDYAYPAIVAGSDDVLYVSLAVSGPGTPAGARNPTTQPAYWTTLYAYISPSSAPGVTLYTDEDSLDYLVPEASSLDIADEVTSGGVVGSFASVALDPSDIIELRVKQMYLDGSTITSGATSTVKIWMKINGVHTILGPDDNGGSDIRSIDGQTTLRGVKNGEYLSSIRGYDTNTIQFAASDVISVAGDHLVEIYAVETYRPTVTGTATIKGTTLTTKYELRVIA